MVEPSPKIRCGREWPPLRLVASTRFGRTWGRPANNGQGGKESFLRIPESDAQHLKKVGIIRPVSGQPAAGWPVPLSVVEWKPARWRHHFVGRPKAKDEQDDNEADVPVGVASPGVWGGLRRDGDAAGPEGASSLQAALPKKRLARVSGAGQKRGNPWSLPHRRGAANTAPKTPHTITRTIAGDPEVVKPKCAAARAPRIHAWIRTIRISVPRGVVGSWGPVFDESLRECGARGGGKIFLAEWCDFIGVRFNHAGHTGPLS